MSFSRRAQRLAESATVRCARRALELRAAGHDLIDLTAGEPDFQSPDAALDAARRALDAGLTKYTPAAGLPDLREAVAGSYRRRFGADWRAHRALITVGAKAALFQVFQVWVDDGDDVVIPYPAWVSFEEQVRLAGGRPITVPMSADDGFRIHARPLLDAMTPTTRAIVINSPCNPTGGLITADDLRRLAEACADRDALLICDETYERFVYDGGHHASGAALAAEFPDHILVISSFSKTWAMTGWRVGFALGPGALIAKMAQLQGHMTSNPMTFAMHGAVSALEDAEEDVEAMLEAFARRRALATEALQGLPGVTCGAPSGAFYAFPRLDVAAKRGSLEVAEALLDHGVAVIPGAAFGADAHLRLSFACAEDTLLEGIDRLRRALPEL
ncbi:MAG: pyridoxal phosphate-dependent aminotransferase [Acidobacteriota bacterium]